MTRGERVFVGIAGAALSGLFVAELFDGYEPKKLSIAFMVLLWGPVLILHEAGHALVARAVGWHVSEIVIGFGRDVARFRLGRTRVRLKLAPVEGYVVPAPSDAEHARLKTALVYAGGPGSQLALIGLLRAFAGPGLFEPSTDIAVIAAQSLALTAAIGAAFTLFPYRTARGASDGLGILRSITLTPQQIEAQRVWPVIAEASTLVARDQPDRALAVLLAAAQQFPDNPRLRLSAALTLAAKGELDQASVEVDELGPEAELDPPLLAEVLHTRARIALESDRANEHWEAERAIGRALALQPDRSDFQTTRGALLVERGHYAAAETLLLGALRGDDEEEIDRCLGYLVQAARGLGNRDQAEVYAETLRDRGAAAKWQRIAAGKRRIVSEI